MGSSKLENFFHGFKKSWGTKVSGEKAAQMIDRVEIKEVFTPRRSEVNEAMYVSRPDLEEYLKQALKRDMHTLIFGESGNGKSWLYKKVLAELGLPFVVANCANASRVSSITQEIGTVIFGGGHAVKSGYEEQKGTKVNAAVAQGELSSKQKFDLTRDEPLLDAFRKLASNNPDYQRKIIVLDNLESIFNNPKLMDELADIVILLDDQRYAQCGVTFLIVGVPGGVLEYFARTKNSESVSNRIFELTKIGGFKESQVQEIVTKGFRQLQVQLTTSHIQAISSHVFNVTLGIAQRVQEYCEALAYELQKNQWQFHPDLLAKADEAWLRQGFRQSYQLIDSHLNSRETDIARRNQVIYVIGKIKTIQFDSNGVDSHIRKEFPTTIPKTNMGIGSILAELAKGGKPLIKKVADTNDYAVADPRYIMCIRIMLFKEAQSQKVLKKRFAM